MSVDEFTVTPWSVEGDVDYEKLVQKFGTEKISPELQRKIEKITGELHPMLKLGYFFSHRDLDKVLTEYEKGNKFYLYTGRGPSGLIHMGHLLPWIFTKYLQDKFNVNLIFQITDDEKFLYSDEKSFDDVSKYTKENILDIIAVGFDAKKTKILIDTKDIKKIYPISLEIAKRITYSTVKAVFGFQNSTNIGMIGFPPIQAAPCFLPSVLEGKPTPVLIPAAIDQDPYWRVTRDIAEKMGYPKPAQIHSKFLPGLGMKGKMSSSIPETAIFTTDSDEIIDKKISNSFTGGQPTVELQRKLGANFSICPVFWYLRYFFESEKESDERARKCKGGDLLCGECKCDLKEATKPFITEFKKKREKAKDQVEKFLFE
ncbi:MAG TPA: tryptophan--tRNA ligase [Nitrosopumilaceae archaeon]|nr:tryptophan--tRNA ligase [Nitrosopumilaceae archaeon]